MNKPKIEKNIPVQRGSKNKYIWLTDLEVGDSFLWPSGEMPNLRGAAHLKKIRLITRKADDVHHRVWISRYL